jgi:hypothetical protein
VPSRACHQHTWKQLWPHPWSQERSGPFYVLPLAPVPGQQDSPYQASPLLSSPSAQAQTAHLHLLPISWATLQGQL